MDKLTQYVTESIIVTQLCLFMNERIKGTNFYNKNLKNRGNQFIKELIKNESHFDKLFDEKEKSCSDVTDMIHDLVTTLGSLTFEHYPAIHLIIEAYKKDPKSIEGITRKILKKQ